MRLAIVFAVVSTRREKELFVALAYTSAGFRSPPACFLRRRLGSLGLRLNQTYDLPNTRGHVPGFPVPNGCQNLKDAGSL
jgi:hypothetical protein